MVAGPAKATGQLKDGTQLLEAPELECLPVGDRFHRPDYAFSGGAVPPVDPDDEDFGQPHWLAPVRETILRQPGLPIAHRFAFRGPGVRKGPTNASVAVEGGIPNLIERTRCKRRKAATASADLPAPPWQRMIP